jgi:hypothetical protein
MLATVMALYKAAGLTSPARLRKEDRRDVVEEKAFGFKRFDHGSPQNGKA